MKNILYIICLILAVGALFRQISIYRGLMLQAAEFSEPKRVAITFDDGPHPKYTPMLLDELDKRGIKATFFVTGENAQNYPDIIKQMYMDGHLIGNHTFSHLQLTNYNREKFKDELLRTNDVITSLIGQEVSYVRPPYGTWDKEIEKELCLFPVLWSIDTLDWNSTNPSAIASNVLKNIEENDVILMHDCYSTSIEAAVLIMDELTRQGYEFVTVDRLLFD